MSINFLKKAITTLTLTILFLGSTITAQTSEFEKSFNATYSKNIKKPRINGTYIPKNLDDVYKEINELSSPNALHRFKLGEEAVVSKKLALGLGRWMYVNWNFYEGSRISHLLKTKYNISHPEDMSEFLITCYHRHLNKKTIHEKELATKIVDARIALLVKSKIIKEKK